MLDNTMPAEQAIEQLTYMNGPAQAAPVFIIVLMLLFALIALAVSVLIVIAYCKICSKAGYPWALGLLMLVPFANVVLPLVLAFSDWPVQKELRQLKGQ